MAEPASSSRTAELLQRAFAIIREDVPEAHARIVARAPSTTLLQIDDDRVALVRTAEAIDISSPSSDVAAAVRVASTTDALLGVLDGACTFLEALLDGSIFVAGDVAALAAAQAALVAFLQGSVRTPRMLHLLEQFRADRDGRVSGTPTGREAA
jgi:hypothetical protein